MGVGSWQRWSAVALALAALGTGGCMTRHGFVLRCGWSLEANRVPFLLSNGPHYQTPDCGVCCPAGSGKTCALKSCAARFHERGEKPPPPVPPGPARFHPVPTHPVFEPPGTEEVHPLPSIDPLQPVPPNTDDTESVQPLPRPLVEPSEMPTGQPSRGAELIEPRTGTQVNFTVRAAPTPRQSPLRPPARGNSR